MIDFPKTNLIRGFIGKLGLNKTMRSKIKRKLNLICAQNFIYYFILKRETKNLAVLFDKVTSPFILIHVHASLCIIIINSRV